MRLPVVFIMITVTLDAMGIGLILPVMPDLIAEVRGVSVPTPRSGAGCWRPPTRSCSSASRP
jgi:hypothetical protein